MNKQEKKRNKQKDQVEKNYKAFLDIIDDYLPKNEGKHALMRDEKIIHVFDTFNDAYACGRLLYEDEIFSVQKITKTPISIPTVWHK